MESRSSSPPPRILGVLGGVASGKSAAAGFLAGEGGLVVSADAIVHELLAEPEAVEAFSSRFGTSVLRPDGGLDRARLAELVFDPEEGDRARLALEDWTHPRVRARILARIEEARNQGVSRVVLDVPLLLETDAESGLARLCHVLVFVAVSDGTRDQRGQKNRSWPSGEVARREAAQLPLKEKRERADYVLSNEDNLEELEAACRRLLARIEAD
jgi:dephospho-CoA kinase